MYWSRFHSSKVNTTINITVICIGGILQKHTKLFKRLFNLSQNNILSASSQRPIVINYFSVRPLWSRTQIRIQQLLICHPLVSGLVVILISQILSDLIVALQGTLTYWIKAIPFGLLDNNALSQMMDSLHEASRGWHSYRSVVTVFQSASSVIVIKLKKISTKWSL